VRGQKFSGVTHRFGNAGLHVARIGVLEPLLVDVVTGSLPGIVGEVGDVFGQNPFGVRSADCFPETGQGILDYGLYVDVFAIAG
jgi:hypothetical protein